MGHHSVTNRSELLTYVPHFGWLCTGKSIPWQCGRCTCLHVGQNSVGSQASQAGVCNSKDSASDNVKGGDGHEAAFWSPHMLWDIYMDFTHRNVHTDMHIHTSYIWKYAYVSTLPHNKFKQNRGPLSKPGKLYWARLCLWHYISVSQHIGGNILDAGHRDLSVLFLWMHTNLWLS